jgi:hypothetical protein
MIATCFVSTPLIQIDMTRILPGLGWTEATSLRVMDGDEHTYDSHPLP